LKASRIASLRVAMEIGDFDAGIEREDLRFVSGGRDESGANPRDSTVFERR
jgi:hypothetical protein